MATWYVDRDNGSAFAVGLAAGAPSVAATAGTLSGTTFTASSGTPFSGVSPGEYLSLWQDSADSTYSDYGVVTSIGGGGASVTVTAWLVGTPDEAEDRVLIGGAAIEQGSIGGNVVDGDKIYLRYSSGMYGLTTATPNITNGPLSFTANQLFVLEGYYATPGDLCPSADGEVGDPARMPTLEWTINPVSWTPAIAMAGSTTKGQSVLCLKINGNSNANAGGISTNAYFYNRAVDCTVYDVGTSAYGAFYRVNAKRCFANSNGNDGFVSCYCDGCLSLDNGLSGYDACGIVDCVADGNAGVGCYANGAPVIRMTAVGNGGVGITLLYSTACNCYSGLNGTYGYSCTDDTVTLVNCADYANPSGRVTGTPVADINPIVHESFTGGDPLPNVESQNYVPNNTAASGALLRGAAYRLYGHRDNDSKGATGAIGAVEPLITGGGVSRRLAKVVGA